MNEELSNPVAVGRTAELYAWREGQVLKLFYDWFSLSGIESEAQTARAVHAEGLPVPAVGEIVCVNGRNALVYQRLDGVTMSEKLSRIPWKVAYFARRAAELHAELHARSLQAVLPHQRRKLVDKINRADALSASQRSRVLAALETMPDGDRLCHGDFHPGNILITGTKEWIIDWIDATCGNPLADLARTSIIILGDLACRKKGIREKYFIHTFHGMYIRRYFMRRPGGKDEYRRWLPVVAAARLSEKIPGLENWLIAQVDTDV
jgi:aminoglycoside phosphotransferase (APT) family kinase protein